MINTTDIQLTDIAIDTIKKSLQCKNRLQFELNISYLTLQRWLNSKSDKLTTAKALQIISEELKLDKESLLTA